MATHFHQFCLENPMDRGAWWVTIHKVARESGTAYQLNINNKVLLNFQAVLGG